MRDDKRIAGSCNKLQEHSFAAAAVFSFSLSDARQIHSFHARIDRRLALITCDLLVGEFARRRRKSVHATSAETLSLSLRLGVH